MRTCAGTQPRPVVNRMQRQWALCQLARHSWGRLSAGGNTGMHCANLTKHVCIYLSRTACRCDATPVRAVPTRPDVRAGTRPGPVSTGGSVFFFFFLFIYYLTRLQSQESKLWNFLAVRVLALSRPEVSASSYKQRTKRERGERRKKNMYSQFRKTARCLDERSSKLRLFKSHDQ